MADSFIRINSNHGRIGRFCWVNSDLRQDHRSCIIVQGQIGGRAPWYYPCGWWGWSYLCSPHPATPGEAW
jgi:hypothetical protein